MRLVIALASRFRHYGLPTSDLIQEGHVACLKPLHASSRSADVRFSTYATWWIRASMQDFILRNWSIVRGGTSSAQKALFFNLRRLRAKLTQKANAKRAVDVVGEIASVVGVSRSDVEVMEARLSGSDMSLNAPLSEQDSAGSDRMDFLVDAAPLPDEAVAIPLMVSVVLPGCARPSPYSRSAKCRFCASGAFRMTALR